MKDYSKRYKRDSLLVVANRPGIARAVDAPTALAPRYRFDKQLAKQLANYTTPKDYFTDVKTSIRYSDGVQHFADSCRAHWLVGDMCYHASTLVNIYRSVTAVYTVVNDDGYLTLYNTDEQLLEEVRYPNTHFTLEDDCPLTFRFLYNAAKCTVLVLPSEVNAIRQTA